MLVGTGTYAEQVTVQNINTGTEYRIVISSDGPWSPVVSPPAASTAAFHVKNASVSIIGLFILPTSNIPYGIRAASTTVLISSVTIDDQTNRILTAGISLSTQGTVSYSSASVPLSNALQIEGSSNAVSWSSFTSVSFGVGAAAILGASANAITLSSMSSANGYGLYVASGGYNTVSQSTMSSGLGNPLRLLYASSTTVTKSVLAGPNGYAAYVTGGGQNLIALSSVASAASAVYWELTASNTVSASSLSGGVISARSDLNLIVASTLTASGPALSFYGGSSNTVSSSYLQGSTAAYVTGSTGTVIGGSVLIAMGSTGNGVWLASANVNAIISSSTLQGGSSGAGVLLGRDNMGRIAVTTNTFPAAAQYGIQAATQSAGTTLFIASNTLLIPISGSFPTYGIYFNGLVTGATIQNNGLFHRDAGSMAGFTSFGLFAQSAGRLLVERNRFNQPGLITAGGYKAVAFSGTTDSAFRFNDLHAAGDGLLNLFLVEILNGSTGVQLKNNVLASSFTAQAFVGSTATLSVSANSQAGFKADFNDYFSSTSLNTGLWGAGSHDLPSAAWRAASGQDNNSISLPPRWADPSAGIEDFHPRSQGGRYDPASAGFVFDAVTSPTVDRGDPAESAALEPSPSGGRVNQGSHGGTAEASKSFFLPPSDCAAVLTVRQDATADYVSISSAVAALTGALTGNACAIIRDAAVYPEQVTVRGFANNGFTLKIMADPSFISSGPVVSPPAGSTAAFLIQNASVTIVNVDILGAAAVPYGVRASSAYVTLSSVNVDGAGLLYAAGVSLSSWSAFSNSSVTAPGAHGLVLEGVRSVVNLSSAQASAPGYALYLNGASSNTFSAFSAINASSDAVRLSAGSHNSFTSILAQAAGGSAFSLYLSTFNAVSLSTLSANGPAAALSLVDSDSNTVSQSYIVNPAGPGAAWDAGGAGGSRYNALSRSTVAVASAGPALYARGQGLPGSAYNSVSQSWIFNPGGGAAVLLASDARQTSISGSTLTSAGAAAATLWLSAGSSVAVVTQSYAANAAGQGLLSEGGGGHRVTGATVLGAGSRAALEIRGSSNNVVSQSVVLNADGLALELSAAAAFNTVSQSTLTSLAAGSYALSLSSGFITSVTDSYLQGGGAAHVSGSTGVTLGSATLVATDASGFGLWAKGGNAGFTLSTSSLRGGASGIGLHLDAGNTGNLTFTSVTVSGSPVGLLVAAQGAGAAIAASTLTFTGLTAGATAVSFTGGSPVSTFSFVAFLDAGMAFNVDASAVSSPGRITFRFPSGPKEGPEFEVDASSRVDWSGAAYRLAISSGEAQFDVVNSTLPLSFSAKVSDRYGNGIPSHQVSWAAGPAGGQILQSTNTTDADGLSYARAKLGSSTGAYTFTATAAGSLIDSPTTFAAVAAYIFALPFINVTSETLTAAWFTNLPFGVSYTAQLSSGVLPNAFAGNQTSVTVNAFAGFSGLTVNTTYYARMSTAATGPFVNLGSTMTLPLPATQPGTPSGVAVSTRSLAWTWTASANAESYNLYYGTAPASFLGSASTSYFLQTGLSPNTSSSILVQALNREGSSPVSSVSTSVYTLANTPTGTAATTIEVERALLTWSLNGNHSATIADLERSVDNSSFTVLVTSPIASYSDGALSACTTYFYRVRNRNLDGLMTAYDSTLQFVTKGSTPSAPSGLAASPQPGRRIALTWRFSPSPRIAGYRIYYDAGTGTVDYGSYLAVVTSIESSYLSEVLASSPSYKFAVRAVNECGVEDASTAVTASAPSATTLAALRARVKVPESGRRLKGNRVTLAAELVAGEPSKTKSVLFQYRLPGSPTWTDVSAAEINHLNPDSDYPYFMHWNVSALPAADYELRAVAKDLEDADDPAPVAQAVAVDPVNFDTSEVSLGFGRIKKEQTVNNSVTNVVEAADETTPVMTRVTIPPGALSVTSATLSLVNNPATTPKLPTGLQPPQAQVQVALSNNQSVLFGALTATVVLTYPDANDDGYVDGTALRATDLKIFSAETDTHTYRKEFDSIVDAAAHTVTGETPHFSFFGAAVPGAAAAADLDAIAVYPVPWKPNGGNPDEGVLYDPTRPNSGIVFENLPKNVTIKIFSVTGDLVAEVSSQDSGGRLQWDGRAGGGRDAASGRYFAVISAPGLAGVVKWLTIIR